MSGTTNTHSEWAISMSIKFWYVDENKICIRFTKKRGCIIAYHLQFDEFKKKLEWAICQANISMEVTPIDSKQK